MGERGPKKLSPQLVALIRRLAATATPVVVKPRKDPKGEHHE